MQQEQGYDPTKTTHAARFQGSVYLRVARSALESGEARVLWVEHGDWLAAFSGRVGLGVEELPEFARLMGEYGQDVFLRPDRGGLIEEIGEGVRPRLALDVRMSWPAAEEAADYYTFVDTLSVPEVRVYNSRVVTFRLLDFGDQMVFDDVSGSRVRPLTGALGVLFRVIGLAGVRRVRLAATADGSAIARASVRKLLMSLGATVTVAPDGIAVRGVPADREDLAAVAARLEAPLELNYGPQDWDEWLPAQHR